MSDQNLKSSHLCQKRNSMTENKAKAKATYILIQMENLKSMIFKHQIRI